MPLPTTFRRATLLASGELKKKEHPSVTFVKSILWLSVVAGLGLIVFGIVAVFTAPDSSLYLLGFLGFVVLVNPANIFALKRELARPIPIWLAFVSLVVFDCAFLLVIGGEGGNRIVGGAFVFSMFIPLFVASRTIRAFARRGREDATAIEATVREKALP